MKTRNDNSKWILGKMAVRLDWIQLAQSLVSEVLNLRFH
jgi:hypothetical protein